MPFVSPPDQTASHAGQSQSPSSGAGRDDGSHGVGFLKKLTGGKQISRSGTSQPKKRGPKPDSRPALTRRQELNRQAQRTHRERKELYVKSLEDEVVRLKNVYGSAAANRSQAAAENKKLRAILAKHGLPRPPVVRPATGQQPPNHALQRSASQADNDHVMGEGKLQKKGADGD